MPSARLVVRGCAATQIYSVPVKFILSGHIAGVVTPGSKYGYWQNDELPKLPDDWIEKAALASGSWWAAWGKWFPNTRARPLLLATQVQRNSRHIEDEPGSHVRFRTAA
jgi:polyhydroxyalkanoate synthase subunit PhaC